MLTYKDTAGRTHTVNHVTGEDKVPSLRARLNAAEDRQSRTETIEAWLADEATKERLKAALRELGATVED